MHNKLSVLINQNDKGMCVKQWITQTCISTKETHLPKYQQHAVKHMLTSLPAFQKHSLRVSACNASVQLFYYHIFKTVKLLLCTDWSFSSYIKASYLYHNWNILLLYNTVVLNHALNTFDYKINDYKMSFCPRWIWKTSCLVTPILNSFP